jgi:NADH-quinone oxidoreductase subunit H
MVDGVLATIIKAFVLVNILMVFFAFMTWVERKLIGRFQARYGPNRVGPYGLLQPIADLGKMLQKENMIPAGAKPKLYLMAPWIAMACALGAFGLMPFGNVATIPGTDYTFHLYIADTSVSLLVVAAIGSLGFYGLMIGGWASSSKYALLGGMRAIAQLVSYEVAFTLAVIGVIIQAGSLSFVTISNAQDNLWYVIPQILGFLVFFVAAVAESNRSTSPRPTARSSPATTPSTAACATPCSRPPSSSTRSRYRRSARCCSSADRAVRTCRDRSGC